MFLSMSAFFFFTCMPVCPCEYAPSIYKAILPLTSIISSIRPNIHPPICRHHDHVIDHHTHNHVIDHHTHNSSPLCSLTRHMLSKRISSGKPKRPPMLMTVLTPLLSNKDHGVFLATRGAAGRQQQQQVWGGSWSHCCHDGRHTCTKSTARVIC